MGFVICFIPISSMLCISNMLNYRQHGYKHQKEVVQFIKDNLQTLIFTDEVSANIGTYLMAFDTSSIRFVHQLDSLDRFKLAFDEQWLLKNLSTQSMLVFKDSTQVLNRYADSLHNRGIKPIQFGSIMLYQIAD